MGYSTDSLREQLEDIEDKLSPKRLTRFVLSPVEQALADGDPPRVEAEESFTLTVGDPEELERVQACAQAHRPRAANESPAAPAAFHRSGVTSAREGATGTTGSDSEPSLPVVDSGDGSSKAQADEGKLTVSRGERTARSYPSKHPAGAPLKRGHHYSQVGGRFIDWGPDKSPAYGAFIGNRRGIAEDWGEPLE